MNHRTLGIINHELATLSLDQMVKRQIKLSFPNPQDCVIPKCKIISHSGLELVRDVHT